MNDDDDTTQDRDYTCPGENQPVSRAVHLGRLAAFYPVCRECPHRDDTGTLSAEQVEQLQEVQASNPSKTLFHDEGAGGVYLNDLTPATVRDLAAAFGQMVRNEEFDSAIHPSVILANDGRSNTAELTAAASEALRSTGCDVIDIGQATAACLAFAVDHFQTAGGVLLGNPGRQPHVVGLQFWLHGPRPLSAGGLLETLQNIYQGNTNEMVGLVPRPTLQRFRNEGDSPIFADTKIGTVPHFGTLRRTAADMPYLAALQEHYHALRPLRLVVDSASAPLIEYLQKLAATVACHVIPHRATPQELPDQIRANVAHFAASVDGDGETCQVYDERGAAVPTERLLLLLVQGIKPRPAVVLEDSTPSAAMAAAERIGVRIATSPARRANMAAAMLEHNAVLGGGPSGRFWHRLSDLPLPDALMTITRLLAILSRSDEPFSVVLDRDAPMV
jgi:phosphomannomutase